jgi:hypothetical protein
MLLDVEVIEWCLIRGIEAGVTDEGSYRLHVLGLDTQDLGAVETRM